MQGESRGDAALTLEALLREGAGISLEDESSYGVQSMARHFKAAREDLLGLEQRERVAVWIFEPSRLADADRCCDVVDRLEAREVVILEDHAAG